MTTICYKAGVLTFDSKVSTDGVNIGSSIKGRKTKKFLIAAAGSCDDCDAWMDWMENGAVVTEKKNYGLDRDCNLWAIAIDKKGRIFNYTEKCYPWLITSAFYAIGSGASFALGAMANGASAEQAVKIAAKFDAYTGGVVRTLKW